MARYVGFKIGKVHEEYVFSEYYCGGCGFPVTDHDSFCPECGGAFRESDADDDENAKLRDLVSVVYGYYASGTINPCDIFDSIGCQYVGEAESGCRYHDDLESAEAAEDEILKCMRDLGIEVE